MTFREIGITDLGSIEQIFMRLEVNSGRVTSIDELIIFTEDLIKQKLADFGEPALTNIITSLSNALLRAWNIVVTDNPGILVKDALLKTIDLWPSEIPVGKTLSFIEQGKEQFFGEIPAAAGKIAGDISTTISESLEKLFKPITDFINFLTKNWLLITIVILVIIFVIIAFYFFIVVKPNTELMKSILQKMG